LNEDQNFLNHTTPNILKDKYHPVMTPTSVTAFCPGHISGYFKRVERDNPEMTGSIGAGIVINEGVTVTVIPATASSIMIRRNSASGEHAVISRDSPPLLTAMNRIGISASVVTDCRLPIGAGFGLSAAALLATLTAANRLFELAMNERDIAQVAHETEVLHRTGLGDVAACQGGGRVVRTGPGIDGPIIRHFDMSEPIYAVSFGPIHTPSVLGSSEQMEQVTAAFPDDEPENMMEFFRLAREFATKSGLETQEVQRVLMACDIYNVPASMTMLGNGVFAYGKKAEQVLQSFGEVYEMFMADTGVRICGGVE
jgi:pantoate kinase